MQRVLVSNLDAIDVRTMTDEQNWVLHQFLTARSKQIAANPNLALVHYGPHEIDLITEDGLIHYSFKLTDQILIREREHVPGEYRFEVIKHELNPPQGMNGKVFKIAFTLASEDDYLILQTNKKRVVKVQEHTVNQNPIQHLRTADDCKQNPVDKLQHEYLQTQQVHHVHIKKPVIIQTASNAFVSYTVMHDLLDMDVEKIVKENKTYPITVDQLIELTILLWLGLDEQIFQNKILHRDIKPANIRTDKDYLEAFLLDFGLSIRIGINSSYSERIVGTPIYMAPEKFHGFGASIYTEIYEFVVSLSELWLIENLREKNCSTYADVVRTLGNPILNLDINTYRYKKFFADLTKEHVSEILNLFAQATDLLPANRPDVITGTEVFEKIRLERLFKAENIDIERQEFIINSNKAARSVRSKIALMQKTPKENSFSEIKKLIITTLEEQGKNYGEREYKEFIHRLGIRAFAGLKSKQEIIDKLNIIENGLKEKEILLEAGSRQNSEALLGLIRKLMTLRSKEFANNSIKAEVNKLCKTLEKYEKKYQSKGAYIDELVAFNVRISKLLPKFRKLIGQLELQDKLYGLLEKEPTITIVANFLSQRAKVCGYSLIERKNIRKDFLDGIVREFTSHDELEELLKKNKINYLVEFYAKELRSTPELLIEFKKLAKEYIKNLQKQEGEDDEQVIDQIIQAKKFIEAKKELTGIFSSEIAKLTQLSGLNNARKIEELTKLSDTIQSVFSSEALSDVLSTIPSSLTASPYNLKTNKAINPFKQVLETFKDKYLSPLLANKQTERKILTIS